MSQIIFYSVCYYLNIANYLSFTSLQIFEYNPFGYHLTLDSRCKELDFDCEVFTTRTR